MKIVFCCALTKLRFFSLLDAHTSLRLCRLVSALRQTYSAHYRIRVLQSRRMDSSTSLHGTSSARDLLTPPASSATPSQHPSPLPQSRRHPLKPGGSKESELIRYLDHGVNRVQKRVDNRLTNRKVKPTPGAGEGYGTFWEVANDLDGLVDVVWVSGSRMFYSLCLLDCIADERFGQPICRYRICSISLFLPSSTCHFLPRQHAPLRQLFASSPSSIPHSPLCSQVMTQLRAMHCLASNSAAAYQRQTKFG